MFCQLRCKARGRMLSKLAWTMNASSAPEGIAHSNSIRVITTKRSRPIGGLMNVLVRFAPAIVLIGSATVSAAAEIITLGSGFGHPYGVAVDSHDNVFVIDGFYNAAKEMTPPLGPSSTVKTLGSGSVFLFSAPNGIAVDGNGNVFVADTNHLAVKEMLAPAYTTVNTLGSGFSYTDGVAVDGSGNVFVADEGNNAVKEILAAGGYVTVNTLGSGFSAPMSVAVDGIGNVFVADTANNAVKEILAPAYTTVNTLGSGFSFSHPEGVAVDGNGNIFVADTYNGVIEEILAPAYTTVNTLGEWWFGSGSPSGVAVDGNSNIFVADPYDSVVKEIIADSITYIGFEAFALTVTNNSPACSVTENSFSYSGTMPFAQGSVVALHGDTANNGVYVWGYWTGTDAGGVDTNKDATVTMSSNRHVTTCCPLIGSTTCITK
ncbi:MAG TPA: NHL repeat-containing protein [Rudaea sp.]